MQLLDVTSAGVNHVYKWPSANEEPYPHWIEYRAVSVMEIIVCGSVSANALSTTARVSGWSFGSMANLKLSF
jgi:hypothetical protein